MENFCDFCPCGDCKNGREMLYHAQTLEGKWICDVCFAYEICQLDPMRKGLGPCEKRNCEHRPGLISGWTKKD